MIAFKDTQKIKHVVLTTEILVKCVASLFFKIYDIVIKTLSLSFANNSEEKVCLGGGIEGRTKRRK